MKKITNNQKETKDLAKEVALELAPGDTLFLYGDLGSGKTTFVQGLAKALGIEKRILSPTFVLLRSYDLSEGKVFNHIDLYRLDDNSQLENSGIENIIDNKSAINVIEWAQRLGEQEKKGIKIYFKHLGEDKREIEIKKYD